MNKADTIEVTTYQLSMEKEENFKPKYSNIKGLQFIKSEEVSPSFNHYFFIAIGSHYGWEGDILKASYNDWKNWLSRPNVHTWYGTINGTPYGYCEVHVDNENTGWIEYFGILPEFMKKGLGAHILSKSIKEIWKLNVNKIAVHTCNFDAQEALSNYVSRGFKIIDQETEEEEPAPHYKETIWGTPNFRTTYIEEFKKDKSWFPEK